MNTIVTRTEATAAPKVSESGSCCGSSGSARLDQTTSAPNASELSRAQYWLASLRYRLSDRRVLIFGAVAVLAGGAALNWNWLVAAGLAPILLMMAPCGIMCALGMCKGKGKGTSASGTNSAGGADDSPPAGQLASRQHTAEQE